MRIAFALMTILGVLGVSATASAQSDKPAAGRTTTIKVSGRACGACAATVEGVVRKVNGVASAVVSQPKGTAEITFDPAKTNPEALVKVINEKTSFKAELVSSHQKK